MIENCFLEIVILKRLVVFKIVDTKLLNLSSYRVGYDSIDKPKGKLKAVYR